MPKNTHFTPETKAIISTMYMAGSPPRDIETHLRTECGVSINGASIRKWLERSGLTKKRREAEGKLVAEISPEAIAQQRAEKAKASLDRWADKASGVVDRCLDTATSAGAIREVAVATSAAHQALRIVQTCTGIGSGSGARLSIDIGFATGPDSPFSRARQVPPAIECAVVGAPTLATPSPTTPGTPR